MLERRRNGPSPVVIGGMLAAMVVPALGVTIAAIPGIATPSSEGVDVVPATGITPPTTKAAATRKAKDARRAVGPDTVDAAGKIVAMSTSRGTGRTDEDVGSPVARGLDAWAGIAAGEGRGGFGFATAGASTPFGRIGTARFDALVGGGSRGGFGGAAFQVFAGEVGKGAAGLYASAAGLPRGGVARVGATGVAALGAFTAVGTLGYEDVAGRRGFFDMVDLVYAASPGVSLSVGHRRIDGRDLAAAGVVAAVADGVSVVGEGRLARGTGGSGPDLAALLGVRFALGGATSGWPPPSRHDEDLLTPARRPH